MGAHCTVSLRGEAGAGHGGVPRPEVGGREMQGWPHTTKVGLQP